METFKNIFSTKVILTSLIIIWVIIGPYDLIYKKTQLMNSMKPGQIWVNAVSNNESDPFKRDSTILYRLILDKKEGYIKYLEADKPKFDTSKCYIRTYGHSCRAFTFTFYSRLYKPALK